MKTTAESIPVERLLLEGKCSPNCLLALNDEGQKNCSCRCNGRYHGVLSDAYVEENKIPDLWYSEDDFVPLDRSEFVNCEKYGADEFHRAWQAAHGYFQAVIRYSQRDYRVLFDFRQQRSAAPDWAHEEFHKLCDLLLAARRVRLIGLNTNPDDYSFYVEATGFRSLEEATVFYDAVYNLKYFTMIPGQWERFSENLRNLANLEMEKTV